MNSNIENGLEDADMVEQEGEKVVTMIDVLKEQEEFEEDANAVLGASDDQNCTYLKGYIKRQALYACMTCNPDAKNDPTKRAGVCLACSLKCHEDHELVELYTKRNFRCDCGNAKFGSHHCQFTPSKLHLNEENSYNQNFSGLYCICHRPYPDPDVTEDDEMIQCIICEDWLHFAHVDASIPDSDQYAEMVCKSCMQKKNFLHSYSELIVNSDVDLVDITLNSACNDGNDENINVVDTTSNVYINNTEKLHVESINYDSVLENKDFSLERADTTKDMEINILSDDNTKQHIANKPEGDISCIENKINVVETEQKSCSNVSNSPSLELNDDNLNQKVVGVANDSENVSNNKECNMALDSSQEISEEIIGCESTVTSQIDINTLNNKSEISENCIPQESVESSLSSTASNSCNVVQDILLNENKSLVTNEIDEKSTTLSSAAENKEIQPETLCGGNKEAEHYRDITSQNKEPNNNPKVIDDNRGTETSIDELQVDSSKSPETGYSDEELLKKEEEKLLEECDETENFNDNDIIQTVDDNIANVTKCNLDSSQEKNILSDEEFKSTNCSEKNNSIVNAPFDNTISINNIDKSSLITNNESSCNENTNVGNSTKLFISDDSIDNTDKPDKKRKLSLEDQANDLGSKKFKLDFKPCVKPKEIKQKYRGATFWPANFRQKLCTCNECLTVYKDLSVLFLIDPDDTVTAYENLGKEMIGKPASEYEKGLAALSSLDRVQQINALTEYNKLRDKLLDFLKSFKDRKEIVKEEDIKAFFAGMKPKREPDGVYFCR